MHQPIFADNDLQATFDKQGFVILPLLSNIEIELLNNLFHQFHQNLPDNLFASSSYSNNLSYKLNINQEISKIIFPLLKKHFVNFSYFGSSFLYKTPGTSNQLMMHQDWTIVDEKKYVALNIWTALTDTNETNGTLYVLPGSHSTNLFTLRAPTLPFFFSGNESVIFPELVPVCVPAGTAIVLNQSLIHYSPPNITNKLRIAITSGIKTKAAPMIFYFKNPQMHSNVLEKFELKENFFFHFENFHQDIYARPASDKNAELVNFTMPLFTKAELIQLIIQMKTSAGFTPSVFNNQQENHNWWQNVLTKWSNRKKQLKEQLFIKRN